MERDDAEIEELKAKEIILGGWIAAIRVATYIIHYAREVFKSK